MGRRILIQAVKRSPIDIRPLLGIETSHNPAAIGHALSGYLRTTVVPSAVRDEQVERLVELLHRLRVPGYAEPCWSYPFDVETRVFFYPRTTPNTIATAFCGLALLDLHETTRDDSALRLAEGVGDFFLRHVPQSEAPGGAYFGYFPGDRTAIHNASMLAAGLLARLSLSCGRDDFAKAAVRAALCVVAHQADDGSWPYGERSDLRWVDNHHTGYVLDSLMRCMEITDDERLPAAYDRGLAFYRSNLFLDDGTPRFYANRTHPIDSQCMAQAISTLTAASARDAEALDHARAVAGFALRRMRRRDGAFVFQRGRFVHNRAAHMRWTQAPMFDALTLLVARIECEERR